MNHPNLINIFLMSYFFAMTVLGFKYFDSFINACDIRASKIQFAYVELTKHESPYWHIVFTSFIIDWFSWRHPRRNWEANDKSSLLDCYWNRPGYRVQVSPLTACVRMRKTASRARICKRLWSPGIDSEESILPAHVAWRASSTNRVFVRARQAGNRYLGSLKGLQIRAQRSCAEVNSLHQRKCWTNSVVVLYESLLWGLHQPTCAEISTCPAPLYFHPHFSLVQLMFLS